MRNHWITAVIKLNWANLTIHKKGFLFMLAFMCFQSMVYFAIWVIIFHQISSLRGWGLQDIAFLAGCSSIGYGVIFSLLGGINRLGDTIQSGKLDIHLARPRSPLLLAVLERMRADSMGDVLSGVVMLTFFARPPLSLIPLLVVVCVSAGLVCVSFRLVAHTCAFWGMNQDASESVYMSFFITATNPQKGFHPYLKFIFLTVFPAGYIGFLPVEIIRHFRWDYFLLQIGSSAAFFMFALWLFQYGLKRYTSGNMFLVLR